MPNPSMFVSSPWHLPFFFTRRIESQTRLVRPIAQKGTLFPLCFRTPSIQADGPPFRRLSSSSPIPVDPDPIHPLTKGVVRSQPRMGRQGAHPILRGSPSPAHPPSHRNHPPSLCSSLDLVPSPRPSIFPGPSPRLRISPGELRLAGEAREGVEEADLEHRKDRHHDERWMTVQAMLPSDPECRNEGRRMQEHHARAMKLAEEAGNRTHGKRDARCQVTGCGAPIQSAYHARHRVCPAHAKASCVEMNGVKLRFCQQCSKLHPLEDFDGKLKSCKKTLQKHNERRKQGNAKPNGCSSNNNNGAQPKNSGGFGTQLVGTKRSAAAIENQAGALSRGTKHANTVENKTSLANVSKYIKHTLPPKQESSRDFGVIQQTGTVPGVYAQQQGTEQSGVLEEAGLINLDSLLGAQATFHPMDVQHATMETNNSFLPSFGSYDFSKLDFIRSGTPTVGGSHGDHGVDPLSNHPPGLFSHLMAPTFSGEGGVFSMQQGSHQTAMFPTFSGGFLNWDLGQPHPEH